MVEKLRNPHFTLYVDESGDQDLERFRTEQRQRGSDPFLVFGGALIPTHQAEGFRSALSNIIEEIDVSALHCKEISHLKRAYFARKVAEMRVLLFAVISKKETVGDYEALIKGDKKRQDYYNKCASYLVERVGHFMSVNNFSSDQLSIVFEKKNHDYQRMRNFFKAIKERPFDKRANYMSFVDTLGVTAEGKKDEPLLSLADLVAFSAHCAVSETKSNFAIPEQRYLRELKDKFWRCPETEMIANHGLKFIKGPYKMRLQGETLKFAEKFYRKKETS